MFKSRFSLLPVDNFDTDDSDEIISPKVTKEIKKAKGYVSINNETITINERNGLMTKEDLKACLHLQAEILNIVHPKDVKNIIKFFKNSGAKSIKFYIDKFDRCFSLTLPDSIESVEFYNYYFNVVGSSIKKIIYYRLVKLPVINVPDVDFHCCSIDYKFENNIENVKIYYPSSIYVSYEDKPINIFLTQSIKTLVVIGNPYVVDTVNIRLGSNTTFDLIKIENIIPKFSRNENIRIRKLILKKLKVSYELISSLRNIVDEIYFIDIDFRRGMNTFLLETNANKLVLFKCAGNIVIQSGSNTNIKIVDDNSLAIQSFIGNKPMSVTTNCTEMYMSLIGSPENIEQDHMEFIVSKELHFESFARSEFWPTPKPPRVRNNAILNRDLEEIIQRELECA